MRDATFFTRPTAGWQRRYEALRASFVERLPDRIVAERFGYSPGYISLLRHQFRHGKIDFSEPIAEGKATRWKISAGARQKIIDWRQRQLSAGEIAELLAQEDIDVSVRTVERVLAEEGFPKLPRRTQLKIGRTVKGADVPARAESILPARVEGKRMESAGAGVFLFAPFLAQLGLNEVLRKAKLPESKYISAQSYVLSFLALKLLGTERYAHVGDHAFDPGLGLFAGLNVLPKCTALSTYSYSLDQAHITRLQEAFVSRVSRLGLYDGSVVNLDFHTVPHFGDESVLDEHWAGARSKRMKGALTLFAQDAQSKLILYTAADIQCREADDQVLAFLPFWQRLCRGVPSTFIFDSKFTTYSNLAELDRQGIKFITLRRRGQKLLDHAAKLEPWTRIKIPHEKRKYPNPLVHESKVELRGYEGELRQIIVRGNGHEKPAFLITNDFDAPVELLVGNYARRWRVENGIAEAVKFFHLNALSSPILIKVHFDLVMTMIADTLYWRLAQNLRGFESCDAPKIFRHFVRGQGIVEVKDGQVIVTYPKRAHNPILRAVPWQHLPTSLPWLGGAELTLQFK
ncbi:transposase [Clostridiales bacterium PH28_bin88]|nr:transposase [Clostridiales bacterium PH28_bin88]